MRLLEHTARYIQAMFRMGTDPSMDPRIAKRIVLSNQISLSIAALSAPYVLIYLMNGAGVMAWAQIPLLLGYISVHRLNHAGYTWISRFGLMTLTNLDILTFTLALGKSVGLNFFLLPAGWAPLALFDGRERKSILWGICLSSGLFLGTEALAPWTGLVAPVPDASVHRLRFLEMLTMVAAQCLLILYFFRANRAAEMALARAGEAAREADRVKSRFLARMSEEIRSPLGNILGVSHLLLKSSLTPQRRETLEDIQLSAQDLLRIVDEILDLSRIESGKMRLEPVPFSPLRLANSVLRPFEYEAGRKNLVLSLEAGEDLPSRLVGDASRIKQVLRNLLGNAFKFTESGRIILRIGNGAQPPGATVHWMFFEVEDTGMGIPEAIRGRIFEAFTQGDASTTRKYGGTGLGLFISRQMLELMGGTIAFRPGDRGGSIFRFSLPLGRIGEGRPESEAASPANGISPSEIDLRPPESSRAPRILVADGDPLIRKIMAEYLSCHGLAARSAESAERALEACARDPYQIIFMDCHMPGMDGYECARRLRLDPGPGPRAVIIGLTAEPEEGGRRRCLEAGMDGLLAKPVMERDLRRILEEFARQQLPSDSQPYGRASEPPVGIS